MRIDPDNPPKFYFIQVQEAGTDLTQETSYLDFQTGSTVTLDAANNRARVNTSYTTLGFTTPVGNSGKVLRSDNTNWVASTFTTVDTFAQGSIPHASAANTITALADVATGNALISGGVGVVPSYGKIGLTTHVSGILPSANGGTGADLSAGASGGIPFFNALGVMGASALLGSTQLVMGGGAGAAPNTSSLLTFDGETLGMIRGTSSSTAFGASFQRTTTDVAAGTKALLSNNATVDPASAPGNVAYLGFWNRIDVPATNAQNFTSTTLRGSNYDVTYAGTGTLLTSLQGMVSNINQSAGAGPITTATAFTATMVPLGTVTTLVGFNSAASFTNAAANTATYIDFQAAATGTITAGGVIAGALGMQVLNKGKTGVTRAVGIRILDQTGASNGNTNLLLGPSGLPSVTASIYNSSTANNYHSGKTFFGGTTVPTALAHFAASTTAASSAPWKAITGALMTTAEAGAFEYVDPSIYFTLAGPLRKEIALWDAAPTNTRVPFIANGRLTDDADLTFATDTLSATKVAMSSLTSGRVPFASTNGLLVDDADFTFATDTMTATKIVGTTSVKVGAAAGFISSDGSTGSTGTFTTADAKTVTVKDGIVTGIV